MICLLLLDEKLKKKERKRKQKTKTKWLCLHSAFRGDPLINYLKLFKCTCAAFGQRILSPILSALEGYSFVNGEF